MTDGASHMVLILGGARSGKSRFAQNLALARERKTGRPVTYVATARIGDSEMKARVDRHRSDRPGRWRTLEAQEEVGTVLGSLAPGSVVLLDCVTMMITNLMLSLRTDWDNASPEDESKAQDFILSQVRDVADAIRRKSLFALLVSNELGLGLVPPYPMGRFFRDLAGLANQRLGAEADEVFFMIAGIPQRIKGAEN